MKSLLLFGCVCKYSHRGIQKIAEIDKDDGIILSQF